MNTTIPEVKFVPLRRVAASLGVPASWLESEAKAGRIPHLKAGRRLLFHIEAVERALLERALVKPPGSTIEVTESRESVAAMT